MATARGPAHQTGLLGLGPGLPGWRPLPGLERGLPPTASLQWEGSWRLRADPGAGPAPPGARRGRGKSRDRSPPAPQPTRVILRAAPLLPPRRFCSFPRPGSLPWVAWYDLGVFGVCPGSRCPPAPGFSLRGSPLGLSSAPTHAPGA